MRSLHNRGRITSHRRLKTLASYNGLTKTITLNSRRLPFLDFDYHSRIENLAASTEMRLKLETLRFRQLIQISGLLAHEGQHALQPIRSWWSPRKARALDEQQALETEQLWYRLLYERVAPNYHDEIYDLSKSAERDAQTAQVYSQLRLSAPCLIKRVSCREKHPWV